MFAKKRYERSTNDVRRLPGDLTYEEYMTRGRIYMTRGRIVFNC